MTRSSYIQTCSALFLLTLILQGCQHGKDYQTEADDKVQIQLEKSEITEVTTLRLIRSSFSHVAVSNGRIVSTRQAELYFGSSEMIEQILVRNGQYVSQGQRIAELDKFAVSNNLKQAENALRQSEFNLQDVLIGQGYEPSDPNIPLKVREIAEIKSGYAQSKASYEVAMHSFEQSTLFAPFAGIIANLDSHEHCLAKGSSPFCSIIDPAAMCVEFSIIERELLQLHIGDAVTINLYASPDIECQGRIIEINPVVDSHGAVKVKARIENARQYSLYDGMNVRVRIHFDMSKQLIVPKTAVVLRSGRPVVFSIREDSLAQWNYVELGMENLEQYTIDNGLSEGMTIIITGCENLAHGSKVCIKQ